MGIGHYIAALLVIAALNWGARRFCSPPANKLAFFATAGAPIVLTAGLMTFLAIRDGLATFRDPHLSTLLMVAGAATILTSAAALLGQMLSRFSSKRQL